MATIAYEQQIGQIKTGWDRTGVVRQAVTPVYGGSSLCGAKTPVKNFILNKMSFHEVNKIIRAVYSNKGLCNAVRLAEL